MSRQMNTYDRLPVTFVSGSGTELRSADGEVYLDMLAGIAVAALGHAHPAVAEAVCRQVRSLVHVSNLYRTGPQEELAERLSALTGGMLSFFCNSGAEAVEAALKLARRHLPGRPRFVCARDSFHGRTFGALSATGQPAKQDPFAPLVPGFTFVPYGDTAALAGAVGDDVCAVVLEPVQGEAGVVVPPEGYLRAAREVCDRTGALLVLDEVQTGLGRTGRFFAHEHFGVVPDVLCLAKALGGGLPLGACLARPEVAASFRPGDHASTFGGGPVQCSAALAVLDVIEREGLVERAARMGERLAAGLSDAVGSRGTVRGLGLLIGVVLDRPVARRVARGMFGRRVLVNAATDSVVRFAPPLVVGEEDVLRAARALKEVLDEVEQAA